MRTCTPFVAVSALTLLGACAGRADSAITNGNYVFRLNEAGRVAVMQIPDNEFATWAIGDPADADFQLMTRRVYTHLQDAFDFIFLVNDLDGTPVGASNVASSKPTRNDTLGIGQGLFDNTAGFGSAGHLQNVTHLRAKTGIRNGPSLHELFHRWGAYLPELPTAAAGFHWGFTSVGGQLGGWQYGTLAALGGNAYVADGPLRQGLGFFPNANGGNSVPYSPLELYLMGLIEAEALTDPIQIADNAAFDGTGPGHFTASAIRTLPSAEIVAAHGRRIPTPSSSQRTFRAAIVVLARLPLTLSRWASYDSDAQALGLPGDDGTAFYNFWEATGGRATLQVDGLNSVLAPPRLIVGGVAIDDQLTGNGNRSIDSGETVRLYLTWRNIGGAPAANVSVQLLDPPAGVRLRFPSAPCTDIGTGGYGTNTASLQIEIATNVACGTDLALTAVARAGLLLFTNSIHLTVGGLVPDVTQQTNALVSSDGPMPIRDLTTTYSTNTIAQNGFLDGLTVWVRLDHDFLGDLDIALQHPDGTEVLLIPHGDTVSDANLGTGLCGTPNLVPTQFDDSAPTALAPGLAPYAGLFRPVEPLSGFFGKTIAGDWRLRIHDTATIDEGTFFCWGMTVIYRPALASCARAPEPRPLRISPPTLDLRHVPGFRWNSRGGIRYRVQYSNGPLSGQTVFHDVLRSEAEETDPGPPGSLGSLEFQDDGSGTGGTAPNGQRFYRVEELP